MKFVYSIKSSLPPLSWLAKVEKLSDIIQVIAGESVEIFDDFFVSGVWDGDFETGDFDNCNFACCTGARLNGEKVSFLTPHHINACVFSIEKEECIYLSNSVSFLLACTGDKLDPNYYDYDTDFCCETLGKRNQVPPFHSYTPLLNHRQINIYSYSKITIDNLLQIKLEKRSSDFNFMDFNSYRSAISATLKKIEANIKSKSRKIDYGMIATISRGFDAPTCAVFAREIGCDEAMTFNRPAHYSNDCGTEIAKIIGFSTIHECDGDFAKSNTEFIEAADFASGDSGVMITFEGHKELFRNKLLFCGFQGDEFWGIDHPPYENLSYPIEGSNSNSYEVFLQSNTVLIMIPYIGADHAKQIYDISLSDEMKFWRLGGKYDRPICRRIIEEAGVKRGMFGQKKVGSGYCFHYDTMNSMKGKLSPISYQSLLEFSKNLKQNPFLKFKAYAHFVYQNVPIYLPYLLRKMHIKIIMKTWTNKHLCNPLSTTYILWGVDMMTRRYREALSS